MHSSDSEIRGLLPELSKCSSVWKSAKKKTQLVTNTTSPQSLSQSLLEILNTQSDGKIASQLNIRQVTEQRDIEMEGRMAEELSLITLVTDGHVEGEESMFLYFSFSHTWVFLLDDR